MQRMDVMLRGFVEQHRMKLPGGTAYEFYCTNHPILSELFPRRREIIYSDYDPFAGLSCNESDPPDLYGARASPACWSVSRR